MERVLFSKMLLEETLNGVAEERGLPKAFVEKDFYAVELLKIVSEYCQEIGVEILFSGGTSLSKCHKIIERFSEDLDMLVSPSRRKNFRKGLRAKIDSHEKFTVIKDSPDSRHFEFLIEYKGIHKHASIRSHLKIEITFAETKLKPHTNIGIKSIVSETMRGPDDLKMSCVSPVEIAGDKLSALSWRIIAESPDSEEYDETLIRHLHDLAALEDTIASSKEDFSKCAHASMEKDIQGKRGGESVKDLSVTERLEMVSEKFTAESIYEKHYSDYVDSMSYAKDENRIDFQAALESFQRICELV